MTSLLVAGYGDANTKAALLRVVPEGQQLSLTARVVGEVPDVPAPRWYGLYLTHLKQEQRGPATWQPPSVREANERARLLNPRSFADGMGGMSMRFAPRHAIWTSESEGSTS